MSVVIDPGIIRPEDFLKDVLTKRFPNPFMPDTPQRIATDTSQKIPVRYGQTLRSYASSAGLSLDDLTMIPLVFAGWLRYLLGVDDEGNRMDLSPDPRMEELAGLLGGIRLGQRPMDEKGIDAILRDQSIFSIDLFSCGMAAKVKEMFAEMLEGPGAVRRALQKYCD